MRECLTLTHIQPQYEGSTTARSLTPKDLTKSFGMLNPSLVFRDPAKSKSFQIKIVAPSLQGSKHHCRSAYYYLYYDLEWTCLTI